MNGLTDRLQLIADEITKGETMADIGTDHGFLPLYLWEHEISPSVILCDISTPSLAKAKAAAGAYQFGHELDFRAGNGLQVLENGEVDAVVIAGMGGLLIRDILSDDMTKTCSFRKYILQPRNHAGLLRHWLVASGFEITKNQLVREGKFICEIITAKPPKGSENQKMSVSDLSIRPGVPDEIPDASDPHWELPEEMILSQPDLAREYAGVKLGIEENILAGMQRSENITEEEIATVTKRIEYFRSLAFDNYNMGDHI